MWRTEVIEEGAGLRRGWVWRGCMCGWIRGRNIMRIGRMRR